MTGGSATWSLIAIPAWLLLVGVGYFLVAPMGYASVVVAAYERDLGAVREELRITTQDLELATPVFGEVVIPARIEKRLIRLSSLPRGLWLPSVEILDCDLVGPARVVLMGGSVNGNHFYGATAASFVGDDELEPYFADSIVLRKCDITGCRFHNVTVIGTQQSIDVLREDSIEAGPDTPDRLLGG